MYVQYSVIFLLFALPKIFASKKIPLFGRISKKNVEGYVDKEKQQNTNINSQDDLKGLLNYVDENEVNDLTQSDLQGIIKFN